MLKNKKTWIILLFVWLFSFNIAYANDVFTVDPDARFNEKTAVKENEEIADGTIIYDANGRQVYPPIEPAVVNEDGTIENADCVVTNPLMDNQFYKELIGEITEKDWIIGPEDAKMTVIEFADFQCPGCSDAYTSLKEFQKRNSGDVRVVFRHYPLDTHALAWSAAYFTEAAGKQGYFFEMSDFLFENQTKWSSRSEAGFEEWVIKESVNSIPDIDTEKLLDDYKNEEMRTEMKAEYDKAFNSGLVSATPTFLINYSPFANSYSESSFTKWLGVLQYKNKLYQECPVFQIDQSLDYQAEIETTKGTIIADLFEADVPLAVANIVFLAENGWYDDMPISAIIDNYAVQFGDPSATGYLDAGYSFKKEYNNETYSQDKGYISLYENGNGENSSTVLIWLDTYKYYYDSFSETGELSEEDVIQYTEGLAMHDIEKHTIIGKISEETYKTAESLTESDAIKTIRIIKRNK